MIGILFSLLILALIVWLVVFVLDRLSIPEPVRTVVLVVFAILCIIALIGWIQGGPYWLSLYRR